MKTFKLSPLAKAVIPLLSVSMLVACNDNDSSSSTTPATDTKEDKILVSPTNMPTEPAVADDEILISYISTSTNSTRALSVSNGWSLACGEDSYAANGSDEFGPYWVLPKASTLGSCAISKDDQQVVSVSLDASQGESLGITQSGKVIEGSRNDAYLTSIGIDQTGTDVKLKKVSEPTELANTPDGHFAIQFYDPLGDYKEDGADLNGYGNYNLHLWNNADCNAGNPAGFNKNWEDTSVTPDAADEFGPVWYVPITDDASQCFNVIIRNGNKDKAINADLKVDISDRETNPAVTYMPGKTRSYASRIEAFTQDGPSSEFSIDTVGAILLDDQTLVWNAAANADLVQLMFSDDGNYKVDDNGVVSGSSIKLKATNLSKAQVAKFPHLAGYPAFEIPNIALNELLKSSLIALASNNIEGENYGELRSSTAVQYAGALDAIFAEEATQLDYGAVYGDNGVTFRLWAPTAQNVELVVYNADKSLAGKHPLVEDTESGSWSVELEKDAVDGKYYRYAMTVFQPRSQESTQYEVTDPYSVSLSMNSTYSQAIDLDSDDLKPSGWDALTAPHSQVESDGSLSDMVIYESHVRDFSALDQSTSSDNRGKYLAFTEDGSVPVNHLKELSDAGMTHLHLMPVFDIATINEDPEQVANIDQPFSKLCELNQAVKDDANFSGYCASSDTIAEVFETILPNDSKDNPIVQDLNDYVRSVDSYNWGYDPYHYTVPEGSYATDAEGSQRILEFRQMVQSVKQDIGMNVVVDVVYNHTNASGLNEKSVLDKVVPLYYHRLVPDTGNVETSTCCENTAPEHAMFAKLIDDSVKTWVEAYKIDAFRWDLMGHHPLAQIQGTLTTAREANPEVYFYGEGWNFGEVENNKRFIQATQPNLGGTGIGSFSDRLRDAVRGGTPFDSGDAIRKTQGFATGAAVLPNELNAKEDGTVADAELARALEQADLTRLGMAGNLKKFKLIDAKGSTLLGENVDYNGQNAGYAEQPWEIQNYVSKHDNQTFWDNNMYKVAEDASPEVRVKMQTVGIATVLLGQAIPFNHMGGELLRSKSMQRDSYDYGDWYNVVDFTRDSNNWNKGLPTKDKDLSNYDQITRAVQDVNSQPSSSDIDTMFENYKEMLQLRKATELMTLPSAQEIINRVDFRNTGKHQTPGLIVMTIDNGSTQATDLDENLDAVVVIINANPAEQSIYGFVDHQGKEISLSGFELGHRQDGIANGASFSDGKFTVPAWSVAVFVQPRGNARGLGLPVSEKASDLPPLKVVRVAGAFNGWDHSTTAEYANEGLYKAKVGLAEAAEYKFTAGNWDTTWGCGKDSNENCSVDFSELGMYELTLDASDSDNPVVLDSKLVESYVDKTWYIPGSISGGWDHSDAQKMLAGENHNVSFETPELIANEAYEFKFTCGAWGECEHGAANVVTAEDSLPLTGEGNISFTPEETAVYTVTFNILSKEVTVAKK
ncbi:pullulanase-type alpha-1,6-glucosidase [Vibrio sinaloensis]|uniref:pullulanase-type alpha-1,6-glucosidase n=1 Tax=Photobacterium sp. (strain ATCC 43367) TaxID=379097 RepID=UPI0035E8B8D9